MSKHQTILISLLGLALVSPGATAQQDRAFNPKISLILQGTYADFSASEPAEMPGVVLAPETEFRPDGFSIAETELVLESNVDDQWRGWAAVALENENGETVVALEEAYINSLALPAGLALKAGRFLSDLGYQNRIHSHAWDFVDLPLAYRALLGGQLRDEGLQLRWVAPTDLLMELGVEALRGQGFPGGGETRKGINSWVGFLHVGGDAGTSGAWQLGASHLRADADARETADGPSLYTFTGDSVVSGIDLVYKWAQDGNPAKRNFVLNAEYLLRKEDGAIGFDDGTGGVTSEYEGSQRGYYVQGMFQFVPRWRAGLRYDRLVASNDIATPDPAFAGLADRDPAQRISAMLDFSNSEFSRLRLQYNHDRSRPGDVADRQVFLQYVVSLGAHAAHGF